ncbi:DNA polymerase III subunit beta [Fusobacterium nucleatum]|uniref:DNA polymerase III subunit beta n=1 Tax=Fusobacterium nucleatum TaxID=851 RepID=UPI003CFCB11A
MKFSINRQKTIEIIGEYSNILKDNPVKPSLAGLLIQTINNQVIFKGANTEIELIRYADCEIETEGQVLIKPALLLEYIKLVEGDNITFERKDGYLIVNNAEFSILDDSTYPELTEIIPAVIASDNTVKFTMSLEKVKFLTNSSSSMDTLFNSIKMIFQDNFLEFVSTDSYRLIYMKKALNNTVNRDVLVPGDSIAVIYKIFKDLDEEFSLATSEDRLIVTWKDAYFTCKLLSLSFPDFRPLINNLEHDKKFEFNRDELNLALKKVISVTKNSNDSKNVATFNFKGNQLVISGVSSNAKINQKVNMIKTGEDLKLGMNCKYIKEFVDNVDKNVIMKATNSSSMLKIIEEGNEDYIYLVMPVNIRV